MFDISSTEDITSYVLRLQEIKDKMKKAGLLELFEEALEIQEGFKHLLTLSNKSKRMLTAELEGKRPVGRPRKGVQGVSTISQPQARQDLEVSKPQEPKKTRGRKPKQDMKDTRTANQAISQTQIKNQK
ncbi:hypothetical protein NHP21005_19160 (plasmid) [Helicobacter sp. NHP21005]|uniref:hypothetical protein n=1 Tax=Helicobacter felistomachi TaxID=3040201 RepID=UPI00257324F8|nr:hypothetical protein [Helicobacter sp. NHP21005]BEG58228.1 hypothetical protein NHP21005_19160 [Helicobacter sp. NHP21005]